MYTTIRGESIDSLERTGFIWEIVNDRGNISVVKKDCFISNINHYKNFLFIKGEKCDFWNNKESYDGFTLDTFCKGLDLKVRDDEWIKIYKMEKGVKNCYIRTHTGFRHSNIEKLKEEWNKQVLSLKLSEKIPTYLYNVHLQDFSEFLAYLKKLNINYDEISIKAKKDNVNIDISIDKNMDFNNIHIYLSEDEAPSLVNYCSEWEWDEGIYATISLGKLNQYLRNFDGIDLTKSYFTVRKLKTEKEKKEFEDSINSKENDIEKTFVKLDALFSGEMYYNVKDYYLLPRFIKTFDAYVYELIDDRIFAHKIISEDDKYWYVIDGKFEKNDIKNTPKFNPKNYSNLYATNISDIINMFNENLNKFLI